MYDNETTFKTNYWVTYQYLGTLHSSLLGDFLQGQGKLSVYFAHLK